MSTTDKTKQWKTIATFSTYKEAANRKNQLLEEKSYVLVKIKRGGPDGGLFRIKAWNPIVEKSNKKKKNKSRN